MRIGIDASNLRSGGTVTHLIELLRAADPAKFGLEEVVIWAGSAVLSKIEDRPWLRKCPQPLLEQAKNPFLDRRHLHRAYWQRFKLGKLARAARCDLLFVPGGMDNSGFRPLVAMSRNMLLFDRREADRYGVSLSALRLALLRRLQIRTFRRADGMIFLTQYARSLIAKQAGIDATPIKVIPHGVNLRFSLAPREQKAIDEYSEARPFKLLYVSTVDVYKHQWAVAEAVAQLRKRGFPVALDLVGHANGNALARLTGTLQSLPDSAKFIRYHGPVPYEQLHLFYQQADLKIFASSCENMPNILVEAMAAGLPIACSNREPMPEVLGDAGVYFDAENANEIAAAVRVLLESPEIRSEKAQLAFQRVQRYSWQRCADETFAFLAECAGGRSGQQG